MNKHTQNIFSLSFIFLFSFSVFLFTSCNQFKMEEPKGENVCTLTSEQAPEVRGFRLGMTLEQIVNKYPRLCKIPQQIPKFDIDITFRLYANFQTNKEELLKNCSTRNFVQLNVNEYPEFKGVEGIDLKLKENRLTSIEIKYDSTTDESFANNFANKTKDSLGLSAWTNWEIKKEEKINKDYGLLTSIKIEKNQLLCNKVIIETEIQKRHSTKIYGSDNRNLTNPTLYYPSLFLYKSEETAISESQKKQMELERKNAVDLKKEEDKKKTETFKP